MRSIFGRRSEWRGRLLGVSAAVVAALATSACEGGASTTAPSAVFGDHQFALTAAATKQLGENCVVEGPGGCVTGTCFHYKPDPHDGFVCSRACTSSDDCPSGWSCVSIYPGPGNEYCAPPKEWAPAMTSVRLAQPSAVKPAVNGGTP